VVHCIPEGYRVLIFLLLELLHLRLIRHRGGAAYDGGAGGGGGGYFGGGGGSCYVNTGSNWSFSGGGGGGSSWVNSITFIFCIPYPRL